RFDSDTDLKFSKLSEKLGRSKQELFGQMVDYFYKSKKDPADLNDELLKKELGQGINRIISFIKTQEKEALTPMLADLTLLQRSLDGLASRFNQFYEPMDGQPTNADGFFVLTQRRILQENKAIKQQQDDMAEKLNKWLEEDERRQKDIRLQQEQKKGLKARFSAILNHYMVQRETLNALTQGRSIRELEENVRAQVENL
uniref:BfmA/BtgA family mobilization protein n=1 Tax=Spirosoma panaciterrae TaxID=496058 RepID=UPI00036AE743